MWDEAAQGLADTVWLKLDKALESKGTASMLNALHSRFCTTGVISVAVLFGSPMVGVCGEASVLPGKCGWEAFAGSAAIGSFAWAGEDEGFSGSGLGSAWNGVELDESAADPALMTGIAAPEPPALVLAGLAFGSALCGRSLVMRRRKDTGESVSESETPRS